MALRSTETALSKTHFVSGLWTFPCKRDSSSASNQALLSDNLFIHGQGGTFVYQNRGRLSSVFRNKIPQRSRSLCLARTDCQILSSIRDTMEFSRLRVKNHRFSISRFLPLPCTPHRSHSPKSSSMIRARACNGSNSSTTGLLGGTETPGFRSCSSSQASHSGWGTLAKTPPRLLRR